MTSRSLSLFVAAGFALMGIAVLGCDASRGSRTTETTGEYVDDTVVTTKVKAELLNEPTLKSFQITVKTYKGVVQLSGFVDTAHSVQLAGRVAQGVHGVASVKNDLIVK